MSGTVTPPQNYRSAPRPPRIQRQESPRPAVIPDQELLQSGTTPIVTDDRQSRSNSNTDTRHTLSQLLANPCACIWVPRSEIRRTKRCEEKKRQETPHEQDREQEQEGDTRSRLWPLMSFVETRSFKGAGRGGWGG